MQLFILTIHIARNGLGSILIQFVRAFLCKKMLPINETMKVLKCKYVKIISWPCWHIILILVLTYILIDSTVTPINPTGDSDHGQVVESDSLSDFYPHDATKKQSKGHHRGHRTHKHSRGSDDPTRGSRGLHLEDHSELLSSFDEGI